MFKQTFLGLAAALVLMPAYAADLAPQAGSGAMQTATPAGPAPQALDPADAPEASAKDAGGGQSRSGKGAGDAPAGAAASGAVAGSAAGGPASKPAAGAAGGDANTGKPAARDGTSPQHTRPERKERADDKFAERGAERRAARQGSDKGARVAREHSNRMTPYERLRKNSQRSGGKGKITGTNPHAKSGQDKGRE